MERRKIAAVTMIWPRLFVLMAISATISGFECPENMGCGPCIKHPDGYYEIYCAAGDDSVFTLRIKPQSHIELTCPYGRVTNWTVLNFTALRPIDDINQLYFKFCDLPNKNTLRAIARQLLSDNVEKLEFRSYKDINSQLTNEHFQDFHRIRNLTLAFNNLSELPDDLLANFPNLTLLNLYGNKLRSLPNNFLRTPKLRFLELGANELVSIGSDTFDDLGRLEFLNLWNNTIVELLPETFDKLGSLETLDIHRNRLESMPSGLFKRLGKLRVVNLSQNNFTEGSLPSDLFRGNDRLAIVTLTENRRNMTTLPDGLFANLTGLNTVKLRRNGLIELPENLFWGSTNIWNVSIERNYLSTLPNEIFRDCRNLVTLDLNFNDLRYLPNGVFTGLAKLTDLNLSNNHLRTISSDLFSGLLSLEKLNMDRNDLTTIDPTAFTFLRKLRIAKFSQNALTLESCRSNPSPFERCSAIQEIHLAYNNITNVCDDWKYTLPQLRILNLAHNRIPHLTGSDFQYFSASAKNRVNVDLSFNDVSWIDMRNIGMYVTANSRPEWLTLSIENNPLRCDCSLYEFLRFLEGRMGANATNAFNLKLGRLKCATPEDLRGIAVSRLTSESLTCAANSPGIGMKYCPERCNCLVRPYNASVIVDCAGKGLTEAPDRMEGLPDHRLELDLSDNFLTKTPNLDRPGYERVTLLKLDHNNITDVAFRTIPNRLEILQLNNNNLTRLDQRAIDLFKKSSSLTSLSLHYNPWTCDCQTRDFLNFVQQKLVNIPNVLDIKCDGNHAAISEMTPEEMCPTEYEWIIVVCVIVACFGIFAGTLAAFYYRNQRAIKVWLYSNQWCLWFVTEDELDRDKIYDAFVSYSHKDEEFVVKHLLPKLEEGPKPFKLCVHFRDWLAGEWIPKQIARSVEQSKRTIVVLSPNFLESVWGRMEFRAAHSQALSEGRARVIVVMYGDIGSIDDLDSELKAYLTMNTYVKWGDPWFWQKLKYALPHPQKIKENNGMKNIFETTKPDMNVTNDKTELIDSTVIRNSGDKPSSVAIDIVESVVTTDVVGSDRFVKLSVNDLNAINNGCLPARVNANNSRSTTV